MTETILGIIIGGVIAMAPTIVTSYFNHRNAERQRKHEIELKKFDLIVVPRINAILHFCESIGSCISIPNGKIETAEQQTIFQDYLVSYERLYPYVSPDTRKAMENLIDPLDCTLNDDSIISLNQCLGCELRDALNQTTSPTGNSDQQSLNYHSDKSQRIA